MNMLDYDMWWRVVCVLMWRARHCWWRDEEMRRWWRFASYSKFSSTRKKRVSIRKTELLFVLLKWWWYVFVLFWLLLFLLMFFFLSLASNSSRIEQNKKREKHDANERASEREKERARNWMPNISVLFYMLVESESLCGVCVCDIEVVREKKSFFFYCWWCFVVVANIFK